MMVLVSQSSVCLLIETLMDLDWHFVMEAWGTRESDSLLSCSCSGLYWTVSRR